MSSLIRQTRLFAALNCLCFCGWAGYRAKHRRLFTLLAAVFVPLMIVLVHLLTIVFLVVFSYFSNGLHLTTTRTEQKYGWALIPSRLKVLSASIFLFFNALAMLAGNLISLESFLAVSLLSAAGYTGFFVSLAHRSGRPICSGRIKLLGTEIDAVLPEDVLEILCSHIKSGPGSLLHVVTADSLAIERIIKEKTFADVMHRAELVVPDGAGLVWGADFLDQPLPGRVPGVALVAQVCERAGKDGLKLFFLGGQPGIAQKAAEALKEKFFIDIVGVEHGYFAENSDEESQVIEKILASRPDIIFVALGVPRQEFFIARLREICNWNMAAIGVGGSFDVISQTLPRAPMWMQQFGIEWLFRLWLEPRRLGRMLKIPVFVFQVICEKINRSG